MVKLNQKVFLPDLGQFGTVKEVLPGGTISKVEILTPTGNKTIDTVNMVVTVIRVLQPLFLWLVELFRKR